MALHKSICSRLASGQGAASVREKEIVLRCMYEFEANLKLSSIETTAAASFSSSNKFQELQKFVETMLRMSQVTVNTLETMAALCLEPPANQPQLCKDILKEGISRLSHQISSAGDNELFSQNAARIR